MSLSGTLEERIRAVHDELSPSHRRVAEYLLESDDAAAFATARQIAETLGISESTVVRLAPELGYEGFPALQADLQRRFLSRIGWQPPLRRAIDTMTDDPIAIMRHVLENDIKDIQETLSSVDPEAFKRAVSAIVEARNIYVIGLRTSAAHALYATMRLRLVWPNTRLLSSQFGDLADQMLALGVGDLLIAISHFRYAADTLRALHFTRARGISSIVVTDDPVSPPAKAAGIVLVARGLPSRLVQSRVGPFSLINALVAAAAVVDKERSAEHMARAYQALEEFGVHLVAGAPYILEGDGED